MAVRIWSVTITDDDARIILNLVEAGKGGAVVYETAWYADNERNETGVHYEDRLEAIDAIMAHIASEIEQA
jgi:hypothetical protein